QRDLAAEPDVRGAIDVAHAALPEELEHAIAAEHGAEIVVGAIGSVIGSVRGAIVGTKRQLRGRCGIARAELAGAELIGAELAGMELERLRGLARVLRGRRGTREGAGSRIADRHAGLAGRPRVAWWPVPMAKECTILNASSATEQFQSVV